MVHGRFSRATPPTRVLAAMVATLVLTAAVLVTAGRAGADTGPAAVWAPSVTVSKVSGIDPAGETVTVTGSGFDPAANTGTRPPVPGLASGVYVTFGRFAEVWQPSAGAAGTTRQVIDQRWAMPAASIAYATTNYGPNAAYVELTPEGTFSTTLTVRADDTKVGSYGVATYAAGGAPANAAQETFTAVSFASAVTTTTTTEAPTTTTTEAPTGTTVPGDGATVTGGHLDWGVKASFRSYVTSPIAAGSVTTAEGATTNPDGTLRFPVAAGTASADGSAFAADFGGSVRFTGHGGELDLLLSGIEVRVDGDRGTLVADVTSHALAPAGAAAPAASNELPDVELAALDLSAVTPGSVGLTVTWPGIAAALTEAGAPAFGGFYAAGDALDPLTVVLELTSTTVPAAPVVDAATATTEATAAAVTGTLPYTGSDSTTVLWVGALLVASGAALASVAVRRTRGARSAAS